ncbi:glutamate 5-kinase [uncultured Dialister sp.]|uniref:glutamate 5-kinase n=2 Tax=uncultured Dialister sp. TaxID=278064 RepID=UPI0035A9A4CE
MSSPDTLFRKAIPRMKRIVVKVGTSSLTYDNGKINLRFLDHLARQISDLKNRGLQVILVTSGAIGIGFPELGFKEKPAYLPYKQASAAVGQGILMNIYEHLFREYGHVVGQLLFTKGDAVNSKRYLHMHGTLLSLLELGAVPIINENDAVTADEIKIGDNDTLSAIVASIAEADLLIILSDIDGLYDSDPRKNKNARLIHEVPVFTRDIFRMAGGAGTSQGTGGMYTKIQAAEICVHSGIDMVIAKSTIPEVLERIMDGENIGTFFKGENVHPQLKKRDIIIGTAVKGKIFVDEGCRQALLTKGSSLLPVGIIGTEGHFSEGDTVAVFCQNDEVARGITHYSSEDIGLIKGLHTEQLKEGLGMEPPYDTVIHRDNLLVMK